MRRSLHIVGFLTLAALWAVPSFGGPPTPPNSLNKCQKTVAAEATKYIRAVATTLGGCLFKASKAVIVDGGTAGDSAVAKACVTQLLKIQNTANPTKTLAGKFKAKVGKACDPAINPALTHVEADTYTVGATKLSAANLNVHCQAFGLAGVIDDFDKWRDCILSAADCEARQAIAIQWPRVLEYTEALLAAPEITGNADALPALTAIDTALEGSSNDNKPELTCGTRGLLKTGQTTCYDTGGSVIPCAGTGQDGELQKGALFSYTDNGNGTITDTVTGLMWEKLCDQDPPGATCASDHDVDTTYTWTNAFTKVANLNTANFAGYNDWRLPNRRELESLVNAENYNPAVNTAFDTSCSAPCALTACSCTQSTNPLTRYWSSTGTSSGGGNAWYVGFYDGDLGSDGTAASNYVRAVRAGL